MNAVKLEKNGFFTMDSLKEIFAKDGVFHLVPYSAVVCEPTFYKKYSTKDVKELGYSISTFLNIVSTHSLVYQLQRNTEFQMGSNMSADMFLPLLLLAMMTTYKMPEENCSKIIMEIAMPRAYLSDDNNKEYQMFMNVKDYLK